MDQAYYFPSLPRFTYNLEQYTLRACVHALCLKCDIKSLSNGTLVDTQVPDIQKEQIQ